MAAALFAHNLFNPVEPVRRQHYAAKRHAPADDACACARNRDGLSNMKSFCKNACDFRCAFWKDNLRGMPALHVAGVCEERLNLVRLRFNQHEFNLFRFEVGDFSFSYTNSTIKGSAFFRYNQCTPAFQEVRHHPRWVGSITVRARLTRRAAAASLRTIPRPICVRLAHPTGAIATRALRLAS